MSKTYYMHTLNGRPAFFGTNQICYMMPGDKAFHLVSSLKQIKQEQKITICFRESKNYTKNDLDLVYGYLKVTLPDQ